MLFLPDKLPLDKDEGMYFKGGYCLDGSLSREPEEAEFVFEGTALLSYREQEDQDDDKVWSSGSDSDDDDSISGMVSDHLSVIEEVSVETDSSILDDEALWERLWTRLEGPHNKQWEGSVTDATEEETETSCFMVEEFNMDLVLDELEANLVAVDMTLGGWVDNVADGNNMVGALLDTVDQNLDALEEIMEHASQSCRQKEPDAPEALAPVAVPEFVKHFDNGLPLSQVLHDDASKSCDPEASTSEPVGWGLSRSITAVSLLLLFVASTLFAGELPTSQTARSVGHSSSTVEIRSRSKLGGSYDEVTTLITNVTFDLDSTEHERRSAGYPSPALLANRSDFIPVMLKNRPIIRPTFIMASNSSFPIETLNQTFDTEVDFFPLLLSSLSMFVEPYMHEQPEGAFLWIPTGAIRGVPTQRNFKLERTMLVANSSAISNVQSRSPLPASAAKSSGRVLGTMERLLLLLKTRLLEIMPWVSRKLHGRLILAKV